MKATIITDPQHGPVVHHGSCPSLRRGPLSAQSSESVFADTMEQVVAELQQGGSHPHVSELDAADAVQLFAWQPCILHLPAVAEDDENVMENPRLALAFGSALAMFSLMSPPELDAVRHRRECVRYALQGWVDNATRLAGADAPEHDEYADPDARPLLRTSLALYGRPATAYNLIGTMFAPAGWTLNDVHAFVGSPATQTFQNAAGSPGAAMRLVLDGTQVGLVETRPWQWKIQVRHDAPSVDKQRAGSSRSLDRDDVLAAMLPGEWLLISYDGGDNWHPDPQMPGQMPEPVIFDQAPPPPGDGMVLIADSSQASGKAWRDAPESGCTDV